MSEPNAAASLLLAVAALAAALVFKKRKIAPEIDPARMK